MGMKIHIGEHEIDLGTRDIREAVRECVMAQENPLDEFISDKFVRDWAEFEYEETDTVNVLGADVLVNAFSIVSEYRAWDEVADANKDAILEYFVSRIVYAVQTLEESNKNIGTYGDGIKTAEIDCGGVPVRVTF